MTVDFSSARWRKSSRSTEEENSTCVEVADLGVAVGVRDSKNPHGPKLALTPSQWHAFATQIKKGRLDLP
ncbi:hypothetical protein GCM10023085_05540 [Actinomadura viridis]|uniref:DUF397 domain-containing protein n=1 Tax=Actinomadura viridis TaxID=58110 RepID=A0A931DKY1_9ACTN|nr:DUF397 domain-containing protein [Actinomadura viridis]MBG6091372.1 hypothetical protein [Actinomadura viridis]